MDYSKLLFKKDSKGKIRVLLIEAINGVLIQESGLKDGKKVTHNSVCKPKNVGKANETNPEQQSILQAAALTKKKCKEGYFLTEQEAIDIKVILPMLAKDYKKEFKKVKYPCYVQPKLDGMRALLDKDNSFMSRKGVAIDTMGHITLPHELSLGDRYMDGELYAHGMSFQDNMKLIKKIIPETVHVKFHVYDLVMDAPFVIRYNVLTNIVKACSNSNIELVPTYLIHNEGELKHYQEVFISEGYEGTIVRHSDAHYAINKRDSQLLKYKDFIDETYIVVDVQPSDKDPLMGVVRCMMKDGQEFNCGMKFSHKERAEILKNRRDYLGETAEVRFFEFTDGGLPRFPVCHGFRLDK